MWVEERCPVGTAEQDPGCTHRYTHPGPQTHPHSCRCPPEFPRKQTENRIQGGFALSVSLRVLTTVLLRLAFMVERLVTSGLSPYLLCTNAVVSILPPYSQFS